MSALEFLSFVAFMLLLLISKRKKNQEAQERSIELDDEEDEFDFEEEQRAHKLKELLSQANVELKERSERRPLFQKSKPESKPIPLPLPLPKKNHHHQEMPTKPKSSPKPEIVSVPDAYAQKSSYDQIKHSDAYAHTKPKSSRAFHLVQGLKNPQEMILIQEIIGPPKALRESPFYSQPAFKQP